jgi:hypothetical protein
VCVCHLGNENRLQPKLTVQATYQQINCIIIVFLNYCVLYYDNDRLCGLVEMYCVFCEVRTEFIYVEESIPPLWSRGQSSWLHNGDVLCFLRGTNRIYVCYVEESRPPLWSSGQSSWLHNGDVLRFLRGTNRIYICYVEESRPPLWPSGQSSWLHNGDVLCFL